MKKLAVFLLLVLVISSFASIAKPAQATETICKRDDGSIHPSVTAAQPSTNPHGSESVDWWPMFRHDLAHTGYSTSLAPTTNRTLWVSSVLGRMWSSPAVVEGVVYQGSGNTVYALNAMTGTVIWSYTTGAWIDSSPAVADGRVYIGSQDCRVYALNAATGNLVWSYTTDFYVVSSPTVADGVVYIGSMDGKVYALNAATGAVIWIYTTGGLWIESSPAVVDGVVYVGSRDAKIFALNAATGALEWSSRFGVGFYSSPAVANGMLFVGSYDGKIYALNALTGASIWNYTTGGWIESSPAVAYGRVYIGSDDDIIYALDAMTGAFIWSYATGSDVQSSPAVADNTVFIGSVDGKMYALDAMTGAFIWSYMTVGWVGSSPAVANGIVYASPNDGRVYAFGSSSGYSVSFSESGLTQGTQWSVTLNGVTRSSTSTSISFSAQNGVYSFSVTPLTGYSASPSSGSINVNGANVAKQITFTPTYSVGISDHCNTDGLDLILPITMDGLASGHSTPYTFTGLTGSHTFMIPDKDVGNHPFEYWNTGSVLPTISVSDGGMYTAYYQAGLTGISSEVTGVRGLSANTGFTLQQNFYLFTGRNDAQKNPEVFWCQNTVEISKFGSGLYASAIMQLWKCYFFGPDIHKPQEWFDRSPVFLLKIPFPDTMVFVSHISGTSLSMENPISHGPWVSDKLVLTPDAYITSEFVQASDTRLAPNFVIVGPANGGEANFNGGSGFVECLTEIDSNWKTALSLSIVETYQSTGESSTGLAWTESSGGWTGSYAYQAGAKDQGIFFGSDPNGLSVPSPSVDGLGTPAKALTFSANCPVYLDLYDEQGRRVGYNATSGTVDFQIDNVLWNSNQSLLVFDPSGTYYLQVTGTGNGTYTLDTSWQDLSGAYISMSDFNGTITKNETQIYTVGNNADMALIGILPSKTVVDQGSIVKANVTIVNLGGSGATSNVTLYANETIIGTQSIVNLSGWNSTTLTFSWNTTDFGNGNYTVKAYAWPVLGELDIANNNFTLGTVEITISGDVNGDKTVNVLDLILIANHLGHTDGDGHTPYSSDWYKCMNTDIQGDNQHNVLDLILCANHLGEHWP